MKQLLFRTSDEWRRWLATNHARERGVWIVFAKKLSNIRSMDYDSALDVALCYGWIDSIIKRIDDRQYARKFTPRRANAVWSEINKKKVARLIREKRMTSAGLQVIRQAQRSGRWHPRATPAVSSKMSAAFQKALRQHGNARAYFKSLAKGQQCRFIFWINMAKKTTTRDKRINESINLLERHRKLGLK
jgi:uncharacterized protein YdeI (YjbR/CyaY-like superfamily)